MKCIGKLICLTKLIHTLLFLDKLRAKTSFWTKWDRYNMRNDKKNSKTGQTANGQAKTIRSFLQK